MKNIIYSLIGGILICGLGFILISILTSVIKGVNGEDINVLLIIYLTFVVGYFGLRIIDLLQKLNPKNNEIVETQEDDE